MVIDTSALVAILRDEPERDSFITAIFADQTRCMSAATLLEAAMVEEGQSGEGSGRDLDLFLYRADVDVVPVDRELAETARRAWRRYGKGRHPAGLNFGDCFAYALAVELGEPLLFKGNDFTQTDIVAAVS